jgi:hypothetical protein
MVPLLFEITQMPFAVYVVEAPDQAGTAAWTAAKPLVHAWAALGYCGENVALDGG